MLPTPLLQAYTSTQYWLLTEQPFYFTIGQPNVFIADLMASVCAFRGWLLTAHNPTSRQLPANINWLRMQQLQCCVARYDCFPCVAVAIDGQWPDEHGLLVCGAPTQSVGRWLQQFGQLAAVACDGDGNSALVFAEDFRK